MGSKNWKITNVGNLCSRIGDGLHGTPEYVEEGEIYFINGVNIKNGRINIFEDTKKVSKNTHENNFIPLDGKTLLMSINGTLGNLAFYNGEKIMLGKSAAYLNFKTEINRFYYYYFQLSDVQKYFYKVATGSTIKNLGLKSIQDFEVPNPDETEWRPIAKVLSDLDAKIELNNKINAELEAMAKLIYDYWFVQFEFPCLPLDYRPSGQVNPKSELSEKIRAFCTYKQTGGLPLPDGKNWFVYVLLCDDGSFYKGMTNDLYRRYYEHGTGQGAQHTKMHKPVKVIHWEAFDSQGEAAAREKDLKTGFGRTWLQREYEYLLNQKPGLPAHQNARPSKLMPAGKMVWSAELKREIPEGWEVKRLGEYAQIKKGTLITEKTANTNGKIKVVSAGLDFSYYHEIANYPENTITISASGASAGYINFWREPIFACDCTTVRGESDADTIHLLGFLKMRQDFIYQQARGSAQPHVYPKDIEALLLPTPPNDLIEIFGKQILSGNAKISNNIKENQKLAELRDWLLPMLMNGQVRIDKLSNQEEPLNMAAEEREKYR